MKPFLPFCSSFLFIRCIVCASLIPSCYFHSMWDILHTSYTNFLFSLYCPKTRFRQQSTFHSFSDPYSTICDLWSEGFDIILCLYSLKFLPCTCCLKEYCCVLASCTLSVICGRNTTVSLQLVPGIVFFFSSKACRSFHMLVVVWRGGKNLHSSQSLRTFLFLLDCASLSW